MKRISCQYHIDTACVREICGNGVHRLFRYCDKYGCKMFQPAKGGVRGALLDGLAKQKSCHGCGRIFVRIMQLCFG